MSLSVSSAAAAVVCGVCGVGGVCAASFLSANSAGFIDDVREIAPVMAMMGQLTEMAKSDFSFVDVFDLSLHTHPHRAAIMYLHDHNPTAPLSLAFYTAYTWKEMELLSNQIANCVIGMGLRVGDCVALMMDNRPEFLIVVLAMMKLGIRVALINTNLMV